MNRSLPARSYTSKRPIEIEDVYASDYKHPSLSQSSLQTKSENIHVTLESNDDDDDTSEYLSFLMDEKRRETGHDANPAPNIIHSQSLSSLKARDYSTASTHSPNRVSLPARCEKQTSTASSSSPRHSTRSIWKSTAAHSSSGAGMLDCM